jgi:hypothetical protein
MTARGCTELELNEELELELTLYAAFPDPLGGIAARPIQGLGVAA